MKLLPKRPLNELDLHKFAKDLPNFRGVYMRDALPIKPFKKECGILNLDRSSGAGTHWTAYWKNQDKYGNDIILYYDSFGNLQPPKELIKYLGKNIKYNKDSNQTYNSYICGHLCLVFLYVCCNRT